MKARLLKGNAFFFNQLILPVCDTLKSGIEGDKCLPYYSKTECWSQKYGALIRLGGLHGHVFKPVTILDLLKFDMVVVKDGVLGRSDGAIYRRWQEGDCNYNKAVANSMMHTCWLQIKRVYKLNNDDLEVKRGEPNYDPAYKYMIICARYWSTIQIQSQCVCVQTSAVMRPP
jgi:hypothetical protein